MKAKRVSTNPKKLTVDDINKIAHLANLPLTDSQKNALIDHVGVTVSYVSQLQKLPTQNVVETSQVTGLENVFREDEVDEQRMFTQEQALSNAKKTHNGYFVVDAVFEE